MEKDTENLLDIVSDIIRVVVHWFFCKIGNPIFSPSLLGLSGRYTCLHCGKCHGELLKIQYELDEWINKYQEKK